MNTFGIPYAVQPVRTWGLNRGAEQWRVGCRQACWGTLSVTLASPVLHLTLISQHWWLCCHHSFKNALAVLNNSALSVTCVDPVHFDLRVYRCGGRKMLKGQSQISISAHSCGIQEHLKFLKTILGAVLPVYSAGQFWTAWGSCHFPPFLLYLRNREVCHRCRRRTQPSLLPARRGHSFSLLMFLHVQCDWPCGNSMLGTVAKTVLWFLPLCKLLTYVLFTLSNICGNYHETGHGSLGTESENNPESLLKQI